MSFINRIVAGPQISTDRVATSIYALGQNYAVVARQPLCLGALTWQYSIPDEEKPAYRGAVMLGAIVTVQGRDANGVLTLYAKRGHNLEWWKSRKRR